MPKAERPLVFQCQDQPLVGILHEAPASLGFLCIVGAPQYRIGSHRQFVLLARHLAALGYPVLRFDYRGLGDSSGARPNPFELRADIHAALEQLVTQQPQIRQIGLIGLCDGATAAIDFIGQHPWLQRLVLINPWIEDNAAQSRAYLKHYYLERLFSKAFWRKLLSGNVKLLTSGQEYLLHQQRSLASSRSSSTASRLGEQLQQFSGKTLLLLSERDLTAHSVQALFDQHPVWQQLRHQPQLQLQHLVGADHTLSQQRHRHQFFTLLTQWIQT